MDLKLNRNPFACGTTELILFAVLGICSNTLFAQDPNDEHLRISQKTFTAEIVPILEESCGDCHWGEGSDAGLDLESYQDVGQILNDRTEWAKVLKRVAKNQMPPEDYGPMDEDKKEKLLVWLDQLINNLDCSTSNPGRATLRRLNRTEYRNTIRDLTLVDFQPAENFPGDDVGHGFDNIGDVLSLPPILMEKYLDAAEAILDEAIEEPKKFSERFAGIDFQQVQGARHISENGYLSMFANATPSMRVEFPASGKYEIEIEVMGDQAGDELPLIELSLDGRQKKKIRVSAIRPETETKKFTFNIRRAGPQKVVAAFTNDFYQPKARNRKRRDRNAYVCSLKITGPIEGKLDRSNLSASHRKVISVVPDKDLSEEQAATKVIYDFASRAFRRRLSRDEANRLMLLYRRARDEGDSYEQSLKFTLQAVLVSPNFLFKVEAPPGENGEANDLRPFELASQLSYFLWSSMPDDELFYAASQDQLNDPEAYRAQIKRLLESPRASALVENFAEQWLQLRVLDDLQPDPDLFPNVNRELLDDMAKETRMLFADLLARDGSILELLTAKHSFINERLARHYGMKGIRGEDFRKVSLRNTRRGGILTHASVLTLTSNPNRTSPVKRGKWIMENLLGEEPPPALPDAAPLESQDAAGGTLRERMERHRSDPACASCHQTMDELGFALENFDAVGQWRDRDSGDAIDAKAKLPDGLTFEGAAELQKVLSADLKQEFLMCLTEKMLIYALGRGLTYSDQCAIDEIIEKAKAKNYRITEFIIAVAESDPFRKRSIRSRE